MALTGAHNLASLLFGTPLMAHPAKLEVIARTMGPRLLGYGDQEREDYTEDSRDRGVSVEDQIAVIPVLGALTHRKLGLEATSGLDSTLDVRSRVERALSDPAVRGILLEVDSPGGEVSGIFDLVDMIHAGRSEKPVYAVASESALSAGYAIASAAERLFVPRTGHVGSIGVVAMHVDQSRLNEKVGLKPSFVYAGDRKVDGNPHEPLSERARGDLQSAIDETYSLFVESVARNRGITTESVRATQAGVFSGSEAVAKGLADEVGGKAEAMAALKEEIVSYTKIETSELDQLRADAGRVPALEAQSGQQAKTIAELQKAVETYEAERAERVQAERVAVVAQLMDDCVAAGVTPPEKAERDQILEALEAHEPTGRLYADAVRKRCLAQSAKEIKGTTVKRLVPESKDTSEERNDFIAGVVKTARLDGAGKE